MRIDVVTMFNNWIPESSVWQAWGKPVAFTAMKSADLSVIQGVQIDRHLPIKGIPAGTGGTAVIIDLSPAQSVHLGARLALEGYQPVPLFNAVPAPDRKTRAAIKLDPVIESLTAYADDMAEIRIADDAPPAFMLTNNRKGGRRTPKPGEFDNRWVVFPQDFPSGGYLIEKGVNRVVVIQENRGTPAEDLLHVLYGWQKAGVEVSRLAYQSESSPVRLTVSKPFGFGSLLRRTLVMMGLRHNAAGGFGSMVPEPSEGGSGYS
ncbi:MAG: hypothetical protein AAF711_10635 [Planctomycetota bacterium]